MAENKCDRKQFRLFLRFWLERPKGLNLFYDQHELKLLTFGQQVTDKPVNKIRKILFKFKPFKNLIRQFNRNMKLKGKQTEFTFRSRRWEQQLEKIMCNFPKRRSRFFSQVLTDVVWPVERNKNDESEGYHWAQFVKFPSSCSFKCDRKQFRRYLRFWLERPKGLNSFYKKHELELQVTDKPVNKIRKILFKFKPFKKLIRQFNRNMKLKGKQTEFTFRSCQWEQQLDEIRCNSPKRRSRFFSQVLTDVVWPVERNKNDESEGYHWAQFVWPVERNKNDESEGCHWAQFVKFPSSLFFVEEDLKAVAQIEMIDDNYYAQVKFHEDGPVFKVPVQIPEDANVSDYCKFCRGYFFVEDMQCKFKIKGVAFEESETIETPVFECLVVAHDQNSIDAPVVIRKGDLRQLIDGVKMKSSGVRNLFCDLFLGQANLTTPNCKDLDVDRLFPVLQKDLEGKPKVLFPGQQKDLPDLYLKTYRAAYTSFYNKVGLEIAKTFRECKETGNAPTHKYLDEHIAHEGWEVLCDFLRELNEEDSPVFSTDSLRDLYDEDGPVFQADFVRMLNEEGEPDYSPDFLGELNVSADTLSLLNELNEKDESGYSADFLRELNEDEKTEFSDDFLRLLNEDDATEYSTPSASVEPFAIQAIIIAVLVVASGLAAIILAYAGRLWRLSHGAELPATSESGILAIAILVTISGIAIAMLRRSRERFSNIKNNDLELELSQA